MRAGEVFFDTSVILYLLSSDNGKADLVEQLLQLQGHVSVQVLNEIAAVALRKRALTILEVGEFLGDIRAVCRTHAITLETHEHGLDIAARYGFSLYDSMIVASAIDAGCQTLYSEDLQHDQVIEKKLRVLDPFAT